MKLLDYSGLQRFLNKIKTLLDSKSNTGHTHVTSEVTDLLNSQHTWSAQQSYSADLNLNYASTDVDDILDTVAGSYTAEDFLAQNNVWAGDNTFSKEVTLTKVNAPSLKYQNSRAELGETNLSGDTYTQISFEDKNGDNFGYLRQTYYVDGDNRISIYVRNKFTSGAPSTSGTADYAYFGLRLNADKSKEGVLRGTFRPYDNNAYDLGSSSYQWKSVYAKNYYYNGTAFGDIVTHNASEFSVPGHTHSASDITSGLATVATSGSYNDLSNKPTIPTVNNATLTIQKNGTTVKTFTANASSNVTANIAVPTKVSELTNDSGFLTSASSLDSSKLTGTIDIARLPKGALERLVTVADQTARFALTTSDVQLGDTVKQLDTGVMYIVTDESKLSSTDGYTEYTAGAATSVPWSGVTGKPSSFTPSSHTHGNVTNDGKLPTASRALITDSSKNITVSSVTDTELGYLSGVTSSVQTQLNGKAASNHVHGSITNDGKLGTASRALVTDSSKKIAVSTVTSTELGYLSGVTSAVQTQLNGKASSTHVHGNITNDGKVGTAANKPLITGTGGVVQAGSFGTAANTFCEGNDSRLSDARTPLSHTHTKSDVTDLLNSNFIPSSDVSYTLGSSDLKWKQIWTSEYKTKAPNIDFTDSTTTGSRQSWWVDALENNGTGFFAVGSIRIHSAGLNQEHFRIKNAGGKWADLYIQLSDNNQFTIGTATHSDVTNNGFKGKFTPLASFIPNANNFYDLGSSSYQWNNVYAKNYYYNGVAWGLDKNNKWLTTNIFYGTVPIFLRGSDNDIYNVSPQSLVQSLIRFVDKNNTTMSDIVFQHRTEATETHRLCLRQQKVTSDGYYGVTLNNLGDFYSEQNNAINLGTSTNQWKSVYAQTYYYNGTAWGLDKANRFTACQTISGSNVGGENTSNYRTVMALQSNRDTNGKSCMYITKFRQNRAQGSMGADDLAQIAIDVLENEVRTNNLFCFGVRGFSSDAPSIAIFSSGATGSSYIGNSSNPWTYIYETTPTDLSANSTLVATTAWVNATRPILAWASRSAITASGTVYKRASGNSLFCGYFSDGAFNYTNTTPPGVVTTGTYELYGSVSPATSSTGSDKIFGMWIRIA